MDRGKAPSKFLAARNNKIYMDLKLIIREHALPFLPAKTLVKFRGVCRDWKLMISSPFFAHNQSLSFSSVSGLFFQTHGDPPTFISLDPGSCGVPKPALDFLPEPVQVLSSSRGLLCCQAKTGDRAYYICNPVTMQWKKLPKPSMEHGREPAAVLVFKPSVLNFVAEYKLVCAFRSTDVDDATEFEIYSSKEDSWKVSGEINFAVKNWIPRSGVCVNDVVYWQSSYGSILVFDMTKDRSQVIHGCDFKSILGEFNGKLCSAFLSGHMLIVSVISNIYSNTMQLNSRARLWEDKIRISLPSEMINATYDPNPLLYVGSGTYDPNPVLYVGSGIVVSSNGGKIYVCDLKTNETKLLAEAHLVDRRAVPYVNSFVAL